MTRIHAFVLIVLVVAGGADCGVVQSRSVLPEPPSVLALVGCYVREQGRDSQVSGQLPDTLALTAEADATPARQPAWRVRVGPARERQERGTWSWQPNARHPDSLTVWNNGGASDVLFLGAITQGEFAGSASTGVGSDQVTESYSATRRQCLGLRTAGVQPPN